MKLIRGRSKFCPGYKLEYVASAVASNIYNQHLVVYAQVRYSGLSLSLPLYLSFEVMPTYTIAQVKEHNKPDDVWLVIHNKIYDVTKYLEEHPGGSIILQEVAGCDATQEFEDVGHSEEANKWLDGLYIGDLPEEVRYPSFPSPFILPPHTNHQILGTSRGSRSVSAEVRDSFTKNRDRLKAVGKHTQQGREVRSYRGTRSCSLGGFAKESAPY